MRKDELHTLIRRRADELSRTGRFADYSDIEFELRHVEGYPAARTVLDDRTTRKLLDRQCTEARERMSHANRT